MGLFGKSKNPEEVNKPIKKNRLEEIKEDLEITENYAYYGYMDLDLDDFELLRKELNLELITAHSEGYYFKKRKLVL